ncbi:RecQ family ATP-dependent DNA helicase [Marinomonas sp. A79]|uniref:ATP-dependent DNA helicase RecQ n=1 Tax=Marinomonas vulgaris TaxID=2823372 RepID=A0ABS5H9S7_9GAMM|nr:RecQ family ATP-dependent DNA helicase [Marinomonas vulgaris]MBR7888433.1 RecQ family ATP-dependent DNA helicase [Marinomonas vulgaris]
MNIKTQTLSRFGYSDFRPLQEEAIDALVAGQDVLLAAPTGGGKSLVYQAAGLMRTGVAVIVSPLLSLMHQQVEELNTKGIRAKFLNSTLNLDQQDDLAWALHSDHIDLLYLSPEKLTQPSVIRFLQGMDIALFAIDEAHCIAQWGGFFRPEYSQLGQLRETFPLVPIIALTGTVDQNTVDTIQSSLKLSSCLVLRSSFDRANIYLHIAQKRKAKQQILYFLHHEVAGQTGIIYCRSRKKTEELSCWLNGLGFPSVCYHAALSDEEKQHSHATFVSQRGSIMVATTAYGMGIDIEHVRFVVHMDLPNSPEAYFQEVGRAGRDGQAAKALLLYGLQDMLQARQLATSQPQSAVKEARHLGDLFRVLEKRGCRRHNLLSHFNERVSDCGNCDRCQSNQSEQNVTIASQKLLSLIYYTKGVQPFSVLIQILLGKKSKPVKEIKGESLALFGKGKELGESQWKSVVRHLIAFEYITIGHSTLFTVQLNETSRAILRGEKQVIIAAEHYYPRLEEDQLAVDSVHWHKILAWKYTARPLSISESQLRMICLHKPTNVAGLSRITGLPKESIADFAEDLLALLHPKNLFEEKAAV